MKKFIFTSVTAFFIGLIAFAEDGNKKWYGNEETAATSDDVDLRYQVYPAYSRYSRPVKKEKLNNARLLADFIPGYPVNWIVDYISVEISATCNGKVMKAVSTNNALSAEQKNILYTADLASDIVIDAKYKNKNAVTARPEMRSMHYIATVVPETEAEYTGGYPQMIKFLEEKVIHKIIETTPKEFRKGIVAFTVNEKGEIVNSKISITSGDSRTDKLLIDAVNKMPKWKPAENSKGEKVKQEFEFSVGTGGC